MSMNIYGLREARKMIADERSTLARDFNRSTDPYICGQRDMLKRLDAAIVNRIKAYQPVSNPPAAVA